MGSGTIVSLENGTSGHRAEGLESAQPGRDLHGNDSPALLLVRARSLLQELTDLRTELERRRMKNDQICTMLGELPGKVSIEIRTLERRLRPKKERFNAHVTCRISATDPDAGTVEDLARNMSALDCANHSNGPGSDTSNDDKQDKAGVQSRLTCSNLPHYETVWNLAKASTEVVAIRKYFTKSGCLGKKVADHRTEYKSESHYVPVDVVADGGMTWTKLYLATNHGIVMDLTREGWLEYGSDDDEEEPDGEGGDNQIFDDIAVVKMANLLLRTSAVHRALATPPKIRIVMPKIVRGEIAVVDRVLNLIESKGIQVVCGYPQQVALPAAIQYMLVDPISTFSSTVNIDCTILLALASSFCHREFEDEPWFHSQLKVTAALERAVRFLPVWLYPAIRGRKLVCTTAAAKRMREIVATLAQPEETKRTELILSDTAPDPETRERIRTEFQALSDLEVPPDLNLPVQIVDESKTPFDTLAPVAEMVKADLTPINQSIFLYGWASGCTTITSNGGVAKRILKLVNEHGAHKSEMPSIWISPVSRSLIGKEKAKALPSADAMHNERSVDDLVEINPSS